MFNDYNYGTISVMCCEYTRIVFLNYCIIPRHTLMIFLATRIFYKSVGGLTR